MNLILRYPLTSDDLDFLNMTSIEYTIHRGDSMGDNDSGWCDMGTGAYIITRSDRAIFCNVSDSDLTFLNLKYDSRLKELTSTMENIYNEAQIHNVSPLSVIDSETVI